MPHPVYLHIGPPKTGTTYVQQLLWINRDELLKQGISYPADDRNHHFHAAADVVDQGAIGLTKKQVKGRWNDLLAHVRAHDGPVIISHELLSAATQGNAARAAADLADRELHVIFTARNARALHESQFQEGLKNGRTWTFEAFLRRMLPVDPSGKLSVGRSGDAIKAWGAVVPPERFHVVTMPGPGAPRTELFDRFCSVIGFDRSNAVLETTRVNESIGVAEAELLRRLNSSHGPDWSVQAQLYLKHHLVPNVLAGREGQRKIRVQDPQVLDALQEQTRLMSATIRERGFSVVGDLAELDAAQSAMSTGSGGDSASEAELLKLALESLRWCAVHGASLNADKKRLRARVRRLRSRRRTSSRRSTVDVPAASPVPSTLRRAAVGAARRTRLLAPARRLRNRMARQG